MIIALSGTPGTGKTTLAKKLKQAYGFMHIEVNQIIKKEKLYDSYDKKKKCYVVDPGKLSKSLLLHVKKVLKNKQPLTLQQKVQVKNKIASFVQHSKQTALSKNIAQRVVLLDSHLAHYLPRKQIDFCIITKCALKTLKERLKKRKYSPQKIEENMQAEIFDVCLMEAEEAGHEVLVAHK